MSWWGVSDTDNKKDENLTIVQNRKAVSGSNCTIFLIQQFTTGSDLNYFRYPDSTLSTTAIWYDMSIPLEDSASQETI